MIVSHTMFMWWCSIMVGGLSAAWLIYDVVLLRRAMADAGDARDRVFGSLIGITISVLGLAVVVALHVGGIPEPTHCFPECTGLFFSSP